MYMCVSLHMLFAIGKMETKIGRMNLTACLRRLSVHVHVYVYVYVVRSVFLCQCL